MTNTLKLIKMEKSHSSCHPRDWMNLQVLLLLTLCIASVFAASVVVVVTLACDGQLKVKVVNGTIVCGDGKGSLLDELDPLEEKEKNGASGYFNHIEPESKPVEQHSLGSMMRIILVLIVVAIIIIVTIISMHKVLLRERHRRLSGELERLMQQNGIDPNHVVLEPHPELLPQPPDKQQQHLLQQQQLPGEVV